MIAWSLLADLQARGVRLSVDLGGRLGVEAPAGSLNPTMRESIKAHKADLLQIIYELEERAAVLEYDAHLASDVAEEKARHMVRGALAGPSGRLWLREYAEAELKRLGLSEMLAIVEVSRLPAERQVA